MDRERFDRAIELARKTAKPVDEEYRVVVFQEVLRAVLQEDLFGGLKQRRPELHPPRTSQEDLVILLDRLAPSSHRERVLAIAYHFYATGSPIFNIKDVESQYSKLLIQKPQNTNHIVNENRRKGLIMEADEKKDDLTGFVITRKGIDVIEAAGEGEDFVSLTRGDG